ncbi:hypothetical protein SAMN06296241_1736 [Salinimicrobium sediminis]|uniref:Lipoprotein n=1 Tax=Salinimicrobium sediminis TaxID=1343891 RepID=A0A285X4D3_9FLAO|nr:hypothetical protein [Salinimicrobium sediminis]SOC80191.1 hypothetical protein SAMN06296241_1736 [Salinimicrobium sediminis]
MKSKITTAMGACLLLLLLSCGTTSSTRSMKSIERQAMDVPDRFEAPAGVERTSNACISPLTDPRDGTTIKMVTSFSGEEVGDYSVPAGKYGVEANELLRINCRTGEVLGIVKR